MSARTTDEAIDAAALKLRVSRDQVEWEVLEEGRGGFLGLGAREARIRAFPKPPQQKDAPRRDRGEGRGADRREGRGEDRGEDRGQSGDSGDRDRGRGGFGDSSDRDRGRGRRRPPGRRREREGDETLVARVSREGRPERGGRGRDRDRGDRGPRGGRGERGGERGGDRGPRPAPSTPYEPELESHIQQFMQGVLERMDVPGGVEVGHKEGTYEVVVSGQEEDGVLVGRKGETLDALQHIVYKVAGRGRDEPVSVRIDIAGYRDRREHELADLAKELADQVRRTGKVQQTEPLRASERRIVHRALMEAEGVQTRAIGTGLVKRVCIEPEGAAGSGEAETRYESPGRRDSGPRDPGPRDSAKESAPADVSGVIDYVTDPALSSGPSPKSSAAANSEKKDSDDEWGRKRKPARGRRR